jgi:hypothetical protein
VVKKAKRSKTFPRKKKVLQGKLLETKFRSTIVQLELQTSILDTKLVQTLQKLKALEGGMRCWLDKLQNILHRGCSTTIKVFLLKIRFVDKFKQFGD